MPNYQEPAIDVDFDARVDQSARAMAEEAARRADVAAV